MYAKKQCSVVSHFISFWLREHDAFIYLDNDNEVIKSFDPLPIHTAFFGKTKDGVTAAGVIGATPHHPVIKKILEVYDQDRAYTVERTSPRTVTDVLAAGSYSDVTVYDYQYFNPCDDGEVCTPDKLTLAYAKNHWAESWVPFARLRKIARRLKIMSFIKFCLRT